MKKRLNKKSKTSDRKKLTIEEKKLAEKKIRSVQLAEEKKRFQLDLLAKNRIDITAKRIANKSKADEISKIKDDTRRQYDEKIFRRQLSSPKNTLSISGINLEPRSTDKNLTSPISPSSSGEILVIKCTCLGLNENCFRCYGNGEYEKKQESPTAVKTNITINKIASFSSDSRGGAFSIRENGRFSTSPIHDEFDDDSSS